MAKFLIKSVLLVLIDAIFVSASENPLEFHGKIIGAQLSAKF